MEELKDGCNMSLKLKGAVTYKRRCFSQASSSPIRTEVSHHYVRGTDGVHQQWREPGGGCHSCWCSTPHLPAEEYLPHHQQPCAWQISSGERTAKRAALLFPFQHSLQRPMLPGPARTKPASLKARTATARRRHAANSCLSSRLQAGLAGVEEGGSPHLCH